MALSPILARSEPDAFPVHNHNYGKLARARFSHHDREAENKNVVTETQRRSLVLDILREKVSWVDTHNCEPGEEDPFYIADFGEIYRQHVRWTDNLPRVQPFYAVKCNPDPKVLRFLTYLGINFDCASKSEIDAALATGADPSRIIYAQPCKTPSFLRYAGGRGIKQMTFDNHDELYKIKAVCPDAQLLLRIATDDSASACRLSMKFGASPDTTESLLQQAHQLGLNVAGVSFHVGSGAEDPNAFVEAIEEARRVFDQASKLGFAPDILDIGGGFCAETFEKFAKIIRPSLDHHFPPHVKVIAEPGRYYVASAFTLAVNIIARRDVPPVEPNDAKLLPAYMLYVNDGVYGNFSNIMFDHQHPVAKTLTRSSHEHHGRPVEYSIWGPTCDGIDMINERIFLDGLLSVGDWLYYENMGAYTTCSRTRFNGFTDSHDVVYINTAAEEIPWTF